MKETDGHKAYGTRKYNVAGGAPDRLFFIHLRYTSSYRYLFNLLLSSILQPPFLR